MQLKSRGFIVLMTINLQYVFASCTKYPWFEQVVRQEVLMSGCDNLNLNDSLPELNQLDHILVDHKHKLLYCYVPKVACTNWKRVLMVLGGKYNTTNLMNIPASLVHANGSLIKLSQLPEKEAHHCLQNYLRFVMVRHPFERLLSAYRNKLEDQMPSAKYFQARIGRYIIKKYRSNPSAKSLEQGDDVTFREFVQYLIAEGLNNDTANEHWQPIHHLCHPCSLNYTFIGKYERLLEDAEVLLKMINSTNIIFPQTRTSGTYKRLRIYFAQLSLEEIEKLYRLFSTDFHLFGYDLQDILGYDIG